VKFCLGVVENAHMSYLNICIQTTYQAFKARVCVFLMQYATGAHAACTAV